MASNNEDSNNLIVNSSMKYVSLDNINTVNDNEPMSLSENSSVNATSMDYNVSTNNKFAMLTEIVMSNEEQVQPVKKSKSVSDVSIAAHMDEVKALNLQLQNMQQQHLLNVKMLQNRINVLTNLSSASGDVIESNNSTLTQAKSHVKLKRKVPKPWTTDSTVLSRCPDTNKEISDLSSAVNQTALASTSTFSECSNAAKEISSVDLPSSGPSDTPSHAPVNNTSNFPSTNVVTSKFPPLFVYNIDYKTFRQLFPELNFKLKIVNSNLKKIFVFDLNSYTLVRKKLEENNINFFTYTPKDIKLLNFIIRGLDYSFEEEEVLGELMAKFPEIKFVKVSKFSTSASRRSGKLLNLWLVQLAPATITAEFKKLTFLLHSIISVEPMKSGGVVQCFNCQRFDHIASNCGMPYRCMKCNLNHVPGECQANELANFVCVNCGGNHSTNFTNCPKKLEKAATNLKTRSTNRTTVNINSSNFPSLSTRVISHSISRPVTQNLSYANAVAAPVVSHSSDSPFSFLQSEIRSLFGCDISSLLGKIKSFIPVYNHTIDITEKKMLLLNFLFEMVNNG